LSSGAAERNLEAATLPGDIMALTTLKITTKTLRMKTLFVLLVNVLGLFAAALEMANDPRLSASESAFACKEWAAGRKSEIGYDIYAMDKSKWVGYVSLLDPQLNNLLRSPNGCRTGSS
jgi:hypothetical protein